MKRTVDELQEKVTAIMCDICKVLGEEAYGSMEYNVAFEELNDCSSLLASGFSDAEIERCKGNTTNGDLYDLLNDLEVYDPYAVPHVAHYVQIRRGVCRYACSPGSAKEIASLKYQCGIVHWQSSELVELTVEEE